MKSNNRFFNWNFSLLAIILSGLFIFAFSNVNGQSKVVRGKVTTLNDLRVGNIDVKAKKAKSWVKTDSVGEFFIVCHDNDILIFKGKVFKSNRVKIKPSTTDSLTVKLQFINTPKNKEIAIGYGYVTERQMTSAVSYLENNNEDFCKYTSIYELIRGRFPGVQVIGTSGEPEVQIRGQNSINASNCALYVVDGMVVNSLSNLSPCQVRTINVVKDGSSAIYGSRGANGVVIIETIRGPKVN